MLTNHDKGIPFLYETHDLKNAQVLWGKIVTWQNKLPTSAPFGVNLNEHPQTSSGISNLVISSFYEMLLSE